MQLARAICLSKLALIRPLTNLSSQSFSEKNKTLGSLLLEMLLGMLEFPLFHESTEVKKDVSLWTDMRMESMEATEMKEVFVMYFILFRDDAECFFSFVSLRDRQSSEEICVDRSENVW